MIIIIIRQLSVIIFLCTHSGVFCRLHGKAVYSWRSTAGFTSQGSRACSHDHIIAVYYNIPSALYTRFIVQLDTFGKVVGFFFYEHLNTALKYTDHNCYATASTCTNGFFSLFRVFLIGPMGCNIITIADIMQTLYMVFKFKKNHIPSSACLHTVGFKVSK